MCELVSLKERGIAIRMLTMVSLCFTLKLPEACASPVFESLGDTRRHTVFPSPKSLSEIGSFKWDPTGERASNGVTWVLVDAEHALEVMR